MWHWEAAHPDWKPGEDWDQMVSSYAIDDGERLLFFDPLAPPGELEELAAGRETAIVLTSPWHFSFRKRIWWLEVNLATAFAAAAVIALFQDVIERSRVEHGAYSCRWPAFKARCRHPSRELLSRKGIVAERSSASGITCNKLPSTRTPPAECRGRSTRISCCVA